MAHDTIQVKTITVDGSSVGRPGSSNGEGIYDGLIPEKKYHFKKLVKAEFPPTYASS